jgi:hypothetical protein
MTTQTRACRSLWAPNQSLPVGGSTTPNGMDVHRMDDVTLRLIGPEEGLGDLVLRSPNVDPSHYLAR